MNFDKPLRWVDGRIVDDYDENPSWKRHYESSAARCAALEKEHTNAYNTYRQSAEVLQRRVAVLEQALKEIKGLITTNPHWARISGIADAALKKETT